MLPFYAGVHIPKFSKSFLQAARSNVILVTVLLISSSFLTSCGVSEVSAYSPSTAKAASMNKSRSSGTGNGSDRAANINKSESSSIGQIESTGHIAVSATLPHAIVGKAYNAVVSVNGGIPPYQFSILWGALPGGVTINPTTGTISGTPVLSGTYQFAVLATDLPNNDRGDHRMTMVVDVPTVGITVQVSPANATVLSGGTQQFMATVTGTSNVAVNWSATAGTVSSNGLFTAPIVSKVTSATVTATSVAQPSSSDSASVTVNPPPPLVPTITTTTLPDATPGVSYLATLAATGGKLPYQWSITSGKLPSGISLNGSSGSISGMTTVTGSFSFNVQVTDAAGQSDQRTLTLLVPASVGNCGPPTYNCSRTDVAAAPEPAAPNVGNLVGAGTCFNDPDFGSKVCRLTDSTVSSSTLVSGYNGDGDRNEFNTDSTKLFVESVNGPVYPMNFDPATMTATRMYGSWGLTIAPAWSHVDKDVFYGIPASPYGTSYLKYDTSSPSIPTPTTAADFKTANCLGTNFNASYVFQGGVSNDDTVFAAGFSNNGGQGGAGAHYVAAYKVGSGCQMLDTSTGIVSGDWGTRGAVPNWTSMTDSDGILLHTVNLNKAGDYVVIIAHVPSCPTCGTNGVYFWQIGTTNVTQPSGNLGGHLTEGFSHWINGAGQTGQFQSRLFTTPTIRTPVIPVPNFPSGLVPVYDLHIGWNNVDAQDTYPFCYSQFTVNNPVPKVAWYKEIMCASPVDGTVWRFAHTFNTNKSHRFNDLDAIGTVSQDGRFFMWSSDWMGTLGSESGGSTCTVGTNCRGDVFVVELK
jgi:Putative Ig domain